MSIDVKELVVPGAKPDWLVRIRFVDGTTQTWQVSPGNRSRDKAISTAKAAGNIMDDSVIAGVDCIRVNEDWPCDLLSTKKEEE